MPIVSDAEYAAMLAGGNAAILWHELPDDPSLDQFHAAVIHAIYNAVRQVFKDRLDTELPDHCPDLFMDDDDLN